MERRILNLNDSPNSIKMFATLANIMLIGHYEAGPPLICEDGMTVAQSYGATPEQSGTTIYYRLSQSGESVLIYDEEVVSSEWRLPFPEEFSDLECSGQLPLADFLRQLILYHDGHLCDMP